MTEYALGEWSWAITEKIHLLFFFSLDSIFSTNGCIGTRFMDVAVRMHKLETKWGAYFMRLGVDTEQKKTQYHWFKHIFNMP